MSKEDIVKKYFNSWVENDCSNFEDIFCENTIYSECYGPEYFGLMQILKWFKDWHNKGTVLNWDISGILNNGDTIVVEWYFKCIYNGEISDFNGVSIIEFNKANKITKIKEFQSKPEHYFPYGTTY